MIAHRYSSWAEFHHTQRFPAHPRARRSSMTSLAKPGRSPTRHQQNFTVCLPRRSLFVCLSWNLNI